MMNRNPLNLYISIILMASLMFSMLAICASSASRKRIGVTVSARAATLYVPDTGEFLYSKNDDERLPMASTTKIMTALVALESASPDDTVKIDQRAVGVEGSSAYLRAGDIYTMEELIYALLLQSANDAAAAIAYHIGGDIEGFADMMNERAAKMGLRDTSFTNPHGLDDELHYTTAKDLAILGAEALNNENIRKAASTYKRTFIMGERKRTYVNHNKLLRLYDGAVGLKTGFTKKSGRCLVGAAERDGVMLIAVTLDAPSDWSDHAKMFDAGFEARERLILADKGEYRYKIPVIGGTEAEITVSNPLKSQVITERGEHTTEVDVSIEKFAIAPIAEGDVLGRIRLFVDGEQLDDIPLVAEKSIKQKRTPGLFEQLFG